MVCDMWVHSIPKSTSAPLDAGKVRGESRYNSVVFVEEAGRFQDNKLM
jgi:hypothetical protein